MGYWGVERDRDVIWVVYAGKMTQADGREASSKFVRLMGEDEVHFVADFYHLDTYVSETRTAWQRNLLPHRHKLKSISFCSRRVLVRMGATAFSMLMGVPPLVSEDQLSFFERVREIYGARRPRALYPVPDQFLLA